MNNRQANNGRRRGRGGQRQQGGGNPNQGNRIDNRARGNAAQLLEKYKNLARDAQMAGDRVNTEYYLQFADHYFRVLAETRSRFEEQNPQQRRQREEFDGDDEDFDNEEGARGNEGEAGDEGEDRSDRNDRSRGRDRDQDGRRERQPRDDQPRARGEQRRPRGEDRPRRNDDRAVQNDEAEAPVAANEDEAPRRARRGRPRREEGVTDDGGDIAAVLPPALGVEGEVVEVVEPKPRRRRVKKGEGEAAAAE
ncbi:DUF4167 domain-containing protein [Sphingomonas sp. ST-64]|uniref:DUF4167 domain-containing protein n=1 Tax=Sphingomonas plantiphila TaxID=3163295 RepID=A0ABW8YN35_9SPHN